MFFDRPASGERAVLVNINLDNDGGGIDPREFEALVISAGGDPVAFISGHRSMPKARSFVGTGKLAEIGEVLRANDASLVIFNHSLRPSQERNLESALSARVLDRTGLILDIFAQRARTHEGKLQVELAQLRHMSTRLIRGWTHLERQKGGIGMRGPGETQLETDRRLLRARIKSISARLERVRRQRGQGRRARQRAELATVALVGYTNAGKSTLFNALTDANVYAADQLFATLDPTLRRLEVDNLGPLVLADTVGFIARLPHGLVEAFKATLEETREADLLLHVVDAASEDRDDNRREVHAVLDEIGANWRPMLEIYNKIDLLEMQPRIDRDDEGRPYRVWISAEHGLGMDLVLEALAELLGNDVLSQDVQLRPDQAKLRAALYALGAVEHEKFGDDGSAHLHVRLPRSDWDRLMSREGV
ncbi:MAG: GTPase HflX [Congregibacter sp.]|nr:GTPase HflX [Congregibacter sp.]